MKDLYTNQPKRLFTFGCSFTDHYWATWANILAYDLDCEFYNLGRTGAGNLYISNMVSQAHNYYKFTKDDLVIVCWTNVAREDRWTPQRGWITPGNIYTQPEYDRKFVKKWAHVPFFAMRDFSLIYYTYFLLKNTTQYKMFQMMDTLDTYLQFEESLPSDLTMSWVLDSLTENYKELYQIIEPSFYKVLWNNDTLRKEKQEKLIHPKFSDMHPTPSEHLTYLQTVTDHKFKESTIEKVNETENLMIKLIRKAFANQKLNNVYELPTEWFDNFNNSCIIKKSNDNPYLIIN